MRELDQSDDWIMSKLIKDYGTTFSKSELKKLMLEAEQEYFLPKLVASTILSCYNHLCQ